MTATIHYLRPFQREELAETAETLEPMPGAPAEEGEAQAKLGKRRGGRAMPCGRESKWKKKIGGGVVARDKKT